MGPTFVNGQGALKEEWAWQSGAQAPRTRLIDKVGDRMQCTYRELARREDATQLNKILLRDRE